MAISAGLRRVLRVRTLEEELSRRVLESAMGELRRVEEALDAAGRREREGRRLVGASARSGELAERLAGLEQERASRRHVMALGPVREDAAEEAGVRREEFLRRRVEMRQAETLVEEAGAREKIEADRRAQLMLDDWFSARQYREAGEKMQYGDAQEQSEAVQPLRTGRSAGIERT